MPKELRHPHNVFQCINQNSICMHQNKVVWTCTKHNPAYTHYVDGAYRNSPTRVINARPGSRDKGFILPKFQEFMIYSRSHVQPEAGIQALWLLRTIFSVPLTSLGT